MAGCRGLKLTMLAPVALAIAAIVLGLLAIFSTQWTTGHFIYHLRHNTTVGNRTVSELRLSASIGVAKLCYTLETEFEQHKDSNTIERISDCQAHTHCPFHANRYCLGSDGAYVGLFMSLPLAAVAILVTFVRRCAPRSDMIYGLSCFFYFAAAVFAGMSASLWATAYNNTGPSLFRSFLPPYAREHTSHVVSVDLGHPFALTLVAAFLFLAGMYHSAYYHTPTNNTPLHTADPMPSRDERTIELCPTAAGFMGRGAPQHAGDM